MRGPAALVAACTAALAFAAPASASGLDQLKAFVEGSRSGRATFRQVVVAKGQRVARESQGTFSFQRPGKFRWTYERPYEQVVVGDGAKLWVFDRDLNQVIAKNLDLALGQSPAALLAGANTLDRDFELADAGKGDGLEFVAAKPKAPDAAFAQVKIGFRDNLPRTMQLTDAFGNVTTLAFTSFERNPVLDPAQFTFVPPPGADVVGDR